VAEIRKIEVQSQPSQIVQETYLENPFTKKDWWSGSGTGPEFKPQDHKKKKKIP
jgi:hypothetical protein